METLEIIKTGATTFTAVAAALVLIYGVIKWFQKQDKQSVDIVALDEREKNDVKELREEFKKEIAELKKYHDDDIKAISDENNKIFKEIKEELCILSYAMLAALNGLQQQGCNGDVTKAHDLLEKHLNQKAHDQ